ncbi:MULTISPECIES: TolC family protein [unclassified Neisseria]|uniref:TolC family protein n=1 Tax=unclassified Neisseria TaxID=2623750 RepID=UPI0010724607|nr:MULTISPECIES: TolC family protein [unclassified Neisseria]MBF0802774.1 TolC family protein [Neisseria sp. 19428wB4_WF04]TFU44573.1 TolC family protein [Neisseria sp. WF04]
MKRTTFFQTASSIGIMLALSGCAVKHTADPRFTLEAAGSVISAEETAQRYNINSQWWSIYNSSPLNSLINQAFENNIDLKQAAVSINKALYQANILGAERVPGFNGSLGASGSKNLKSGATGQSFSSQLGLSYEIDLWQKLNAQADAQMWEYKATRQDLAATRLTLANNVADAYFNIAYLNEAVALTEKSVKQYQHINRIASAKYRYGKADAAESRQAQQSLLSAQNSLVQLKNSRETTEETLRNLLNLKPGQNMAAEPPGFRLPDAKGVDLNVPVSALANRPDLRAAEYRLQSSLRSVDAQKRSWYPSITVGATVSTSSNKAKTAFDIPLLGGSVQVNLPFLNWKTLKWENKTAEANFETARLNFEQTLTTALNEVFGNYQKYARAEESLKNQRQKYALDQKNSRYYEVRYQHGKNELKDWLDALNTEYSSAQSLLSQRYEVLKYENMVYKTMAGRYTLKDGR